ncbi:hypothetical protein COOONC_22167 [Cooperia oncophora]
MTNDARVPQLATVSQMVMVHIDCHQNAIRRSGGGRNVDEWSKASLHNAGAKCNALTPIATGTASEADWALAVNRYQADLEVAAPVPPLCRAIVFVDICELIDKFVYFRYYVLLLLTTQLKAMRIRWMRFESVSADLGRSVDRLFPRRDTGIDSEDRLEWLQSHILETLRKTSAFVKKFDEEIATLGSPEVFAEATDVSLDQIGPHFAATTDASV